MLGTQPLASPYACIAADANGSGSITALDIVVIRKIILQLETQFPNNVPTWRFVPSDYQWQNPTDPFNEDFPEKWMVDPLMEDTLGDFIGVKIGDVTGQ